MESARQSQEFPPHSHKVALSAIFRSGQLCEHGRLPWSTRNAHHPGNPLRELHYQNAGLTEETVLHQFLLIETVAS